MEATEAEALKLEDRTNLGVPAISDSSCHVIVKLPRLAEIMICSELLKRVSDERGVSKVVKSFNQGETRR